MVVAPITGIADAARPGIGVEANAALLRRYIYIEQRLCLTLAGHLPAVPAMAIKQGMGRHLWEDAEHAAWLIDRIGQLRTSRKSLDEPPDQALAALMGEAVRAADATALLAGIYAVIKPALIAAYRWHIDATNPLVDFPTVRLLRLALAEEEAQLAWIAPALTTDANDPAITAWRERLESLLQAAGGVTGRAPRPAVADGPNRLSAGMPARSMFPARDSDRTTQFDPPSLAEEADPIRQGLLRKMLVRYNEMKAVENIASTMYETDGMPWAYYHDLARHLWDEVRHSCFGEVMLGELGADVASYPFAVGNSVFYALLTPLERYALLGISIEGGAMKYPPGKRLEFEWCRDTAKEPLAAVFQDYDWADEVLHTQIARKWIGVQLDGDMNRARAIAADAKERLAQFKAIEEAKERAGEPNGRPTPSSIVPRAERDFAE